MSGVRSALVVAGLLATLPGGAAAEAPARLTYVTLNLLHGGVFSGLTGDDQELERRLEMVTGELRALAPDIVGLQEASVNRQRGHVARRLGEALGLHWVYAPSLFRLTPAEWFNRGASLVMNFEEGPALLSRFPIVSWDVHSLPRCNGLFDPRVLVRATLDTPWGPLVAASVHTSRGFCEAPRVVELMMERRGPLPAVLMGDFNAGPDSEAVRKLTEDAGFIDAFRAANPSDPGPTVWQRVHHPTATVFRRVDYIFVMPGTAQPGRVLSSRRVVNAPGRLPDGRLLWPSDHYGVLAEIALAPVPAT